MIDYTNEYANLRHQILARHALVNRWFRTNRFNERTTIDHPSGEVIGAPDAATREEKAWHISAYDDGNPLMASGKLLTCLAVEHHLGSRKAAPLIQSLLAGLESLFKFSGDFAGYVMRGDPVDLDAWVVDPAASVHDARPTFNPHFYVNADGSYEYCVPHHDPRSVRQPTIATWLTLSPDQRRAWWEEWHDWAWAYLVYQEPSQDELVGLIMGYSMVFTLVDLPDVRATIASQTERIATYLSTHSYYLVRPAGGFAVAGAAGSLPAMEQAFTRVFARTTGTPHASANDFPDAMRRAGVWDCLSGPYAEGTVAGSLLTLPAVLALLEPVFGPLSPAVAAQLGAMLPNILVAAGQAAAIFDNLEVFKVLWDAHTPNGIDDDDPTAGNPNWDAYGAASASEFAGAHLLSAIPTASRFNLLVSAMQDSEKGWAAGFIPYLGLTGLDDDDPTVRDAYVRWLEHRVVPPKLVPGVRDAHGDPWLFAAAVGCLFGAAPALPRGVVPESRLAGLLAQQVATQQQLWGASLPVLGSVETALAPLDTMTSIALAWLHGQRRAAAGDPVRVPGFPAVPAGADLDAMPDPRLPEAVRKEPRYAPPDSVLQARVPPIVDLATPTQCPGVNLVKDAPLPVRSPVPPVVLPPHEPLELLLDRDVVVPENSSGIQVAPRLRRGDQYEITATGRVESGIFLEGAHGPSGRGDLTVDRTFPLWGTPDAHPFALVGRLGDHGAYFYVGDGLDRRTYTGDERGPLVLRVNDNAPGNGAGAFNCKVRVWGVRDHLIPVVTTEPAVITVGVPVTVTVHARHPLTGADATGDVLVNGAVVGQLGQHFTHTFTITFTKSVSPVFPHEVEYVAHEPTGSVRPTTNSTTDANHVMLEASIPFVFRQDRIQLRVSVTPSRIARGRATQVVVRAIDEAGGAVSLPVLADGTQVGMTDEPFTHSFATIPAYGVVRGHNPSEGDTRFTFPVEVARANLRCEPAQVETGKRRVTLRVTALDNIDHSTIGTGTVVIDGKPVGRLWVPFSYSYEAWATFDPDSRPRRWEMPESPSIEVRDMPGYATAATRLSFFGNHSKPQR